MSSSVPLCCIPMWLWSLLGKDTKEKEEACTVRLEPVFDDWREFRQWARSDRHLPRKSRSLYAPLLQPHYHPSRPVLGSVLVNQHCEGWKHRSCSPLLCESLRLPCKENSLSAWETEISSALEEANEDISAGRAQPSEVDCTVPYH